MTPSATTIDLEPGDLYWLKAGSGAVHDEGPLPGAQTHGLRIFVNLPAVAKHDAPDSLHLRADDMPELRCDGYRVRVVLGDTNGATGSTSPALPLTILDAHLEASGTFTHALPASSNTWIHAVRGPAQVIAEDTIVPLGPGDAIAVANNIEAVELELRSNAGAQLGAMLV